MKKKSKIKTLLCLGAAALAGAMPLTLYFVLISLGAQGAMMYTRNGAFLVCIISLATALAVPVVIKDVLLCEKNAYEEEPYQDGEEAFEPCEETSSAQTDDFGKAREEYPELFGRSAEVGEVADTEKREASHPYYEALVNAMSAQRITKKEIEEISVAGESVPELCDILGVEKKEENKVGHDIFDDLPDTLPEGYRLPDADEDEEDCEYEEWEEELGEYRLKKAKSPVLLKVCVCVIVVLLSLGVGVLLSFRSTLYGDDGFTVRSLASSTKYKWSDCTEYEIGPTFAGDRIKLTVRTSDNKEVELLPFGAVMTEEFYEKYESVYDYALMAEEKLSEEGAKKTVRERGTLENEFVSGTDIGEYVKKLID